VLRDRWGTDSGSSVYSPQGNVATAAQPLSRTSNGLDQFFSSLNDRDNLSILDFAGASQANISFITSLGHRIYSNDVLHTLDESFGTDGDFVANQSDPQRAEHFLQESLNFAENSFDGALLWDSLQFLAPPLLQETVDRLYHVLRPHAVLLAFFHAEEKAASVPVYNYRIAGSKLVSLTSRGERKPVQYFNNRNLEKLFQRYQSVKFFLTRDHLREVIVRR
jgi:hypothetical protein